MSNSGRKLPHLRWLVAVVALVTVVQSAGPAFAGPTTAKGVVAAAVVTEVRVNQVGYSTSGAKRAFVMSSAPCTGATFHVWHATTQVLVGTAGHDRGRWNSTFTHVCALPFTWTHPGLYTVRTMGATSAPFRIGTARHLYRGLVANSLVFYQAQRDGRDVIRSVLQRKPSHLNDRRARVYRTPKYRGERLKHDLHAVGGRVNVAGGWFDAGDYVKFTGTTAFTVGVMLTALRDHPKLFGGAGPAFGPEALRGIKWLLKMYDDKHRVVYYQVGIGSGNPKIVADHDVWRLPQRDDAMRAHSRRYLAHRPVFRSARPGHPVAPSLAGRLAAAFGLCAQEWPRRPLGRRCLHSAVHVYDLARKSHVGVQVTASPVSYYREPQWRDDLEWGAIEIFRALRRAPSSTGVQRNQHYYLGRAARWAVNYRRSPLDGTDTLNLYDVSALAHIDLIDAIRHSAGGAAKLAIGPHGLLADLRKQLDSRDRKSQHDVFGFGAYPWDPSPHAFGLVTEALAYDRLTGTTRYANLVRSQVDWALGANAWGSSFVVGAGSTFPHCMQHTVANLVGSTNGSAPLLLGATVDGPSDYIPGPGFFGNAVKCPKHGGNAFAAFNRPKWRYVDRVSSWATVEPSLDYTALSMLAFTELSSSH